MQASRKVRPFLEQAAAAAAAAANVEGSAKAQAAAKKAKKLTPEDMKKMRQQADPNYQGKQAGAATNSAVDGLGVSKKRKKGKAVASRSEPASDTPSRASAASGSDKLSDTVPKPEVAATHQTAQAAAQAAADHGAPSGNKRRQGLGFAEEQPQPKRAKQALDPSASNDTDPVQHAQQAQAASNTQQQAHAASDAQQQAPSTMASEQQSKGKAGLQTQSAAAQAAVGSSGAQGQQQSGAAASQGPPVIFTDECTAFVRGLDHKVTEAELKDLLAACGEVKDVRLVMDKVTGRPKVFVCQAVTVGSLAPGYVHLVDWLSFVSAACTTNQAVQQTGRPHQWDQAICSPCIVHSYITVGS